MLGIVLGISHFHGTRKYQPSASNYSRIINLLTFNAGLHVEHHDIAAMPWHRLWKLRRMATEFYDDLEVIPSYTLLGLKFVFCSPTTFIEEFDNETQRNIRRFMDEAADSELALRNNIPHAQHPHVFQHDHIHPVVDAIRPLLLIRRQLHRPLGCVNTSNWLSIKFNSQYEGMLARA